MIMLAIVAGVTAASAQNKGYDKANMDLGVKPGTDFVQYSTAIRSMPNIRLTVLSLTCMKRTSCR